MKLPGLVYGLGLTGNVGEREVQIPALKGLNLSHLHPWPLSNIVGYVRFVKLYFSYFLLSSFYFFIFFIFLTTENSMMTLKNLWPG